MFSDAFAAVLGTPRQDLHPHTHLLRPLLDHWLLARRLLIILKGASKVKSCAYEAARNLLRQHTGEHCRSKQPRFSPLWFCVTETSLMGLMRGGYVSDCIWGKKHPDFPSSTRAEE
jgi:hypothetical protein